MARRGDNITQYHLHKAYPEKLQFEMYYLTDYRKRSGKQAEIPHSHSYYQMIWFFEDGGTHLVDFNRYDVKKNTILFIRKGQIHAFDEQLEVSGWLIHFNESFFMHTDVDVFLRYNIFNKKDPCCVIPPGTVTTARTFINLMHAELSHRNKFGYEDIIRFSLKSLFIHLERLHHKDSDVGININSPHEFQYFQFIELVEAHYKSRKSITQYAEILHISPKTLSSITKKMTDKSPKVILRERLILEGKRLLKFTPLSVQEIGHKLGFDDDSYFVKYFKKEVGVSPLRFRESVT